MGCMRWCENTWSWMRLADTFSYCGSAFGPQAATATKISFSHRLASPLVHDDDITVNHKASSCLLTESDVAKMLTVSLAALRRWRIEDRGPVCLKIGALVRYRLRDVENWLKSRPVRGEPAANVRK